MGWIRKSLAVGAVAVCGLLAAGLPAGAQTSPSVSPVLECIFPLEKGGFIALWGYNNLNKEVVEIPIGDSNRFDPKPIERGQPQKFEVGRQVGVFTTEFDGSNLVWKLTDRTATASKSSKQCEKPPVPVGTGSTQSFLWLAVAAGAIVIVGGGSGTAWFMRKRRTI
jgi:hypothetical protein